VELAVGALWALVAWSMLQITWSGEPVIYLFDNHYVLASAIGIIVFYWLMIALAVLDAENLWLPNWITLPGIVVGFIFSVWRDRLMYEMPGSDMGPTPFAPGWLSRLLGILAAAALILLIRWVYWLIRRREGVGLGDAKLMALLAAWLGLPGTLLAFGLGVVLGALVALVLLLIPSARQDSESWALSKLPLGTFLCIGGIISSLWGWNILSAYYRWAGF
jgi:leader peptidase (prepilin peptidase)/N-methyltransferase